MRNGYFAPYQRDTLHANASVIVNSGLAARYGMILSTKDFELEQHPMITAGEAPYYCVTVSDELGIGLFHPTEAKAIGQSVVTLAERKKGKLTPVDPFTELDVETALSLVAEQVKSDLIF